MTAVPPSRQAAASHVSRGRASSVFVWLLAGAGLVATGLTGLSLVEQAGSGLTLDVLLPGVSFLVGLLAFIVSGAIIASRQPRNTVGWLLMAPGLAIAFSQLGSTWLASLDPVPASATPGLWLILWFCSWSWLLLIFPVFHLLLTFPNGHLPSSRWRWAVALEVLMVSFFILVITFSARLSAQGDNGEPTWSITNPIGLITTDPFETVGSLWAVGLLVMTVASVASVAARYRRETSEVRHQLKWPMAAIVTFGVVYGAPTIQSDVSDSTLWNVLFGMSLAFIPCAVAIAVLKYRLYDIDRVISRTVSWAVVTGLLAIVFAGLVVGLQALLAGRTQGQTLAVAASTLVAAVLFNPVRDRVQRVVDRRFNRSHYDAERVVVAFSERLRNELDLDTLRAELDATTAQAVEPVTSAVWLRGVHPG